MTATDATQKRPPAAAAGAPSKPPVAGGGAIAASAVVLSASDRAPQVHLDAARLAATSRKGYRAVRATHGCGGPSGVAAAAPDGEKANSSAGANTDTTEARLKAGTWYWEAEVAHLGATGHARLGWSTRAADANAPVGFDAHGYGYRDVGGEAVRRGWRREYGAAWKEGDVVGCLLHVPVPGGGADSLEAVAAPVGGKGKAPAAAAAAPAAAGEEGEQAADATAADPAADPAAADAADAREGVPGSFVGFCVNGKWQGRAFEGTLRREAYYPTVSLYTMPEQGEGATVRCNFGPEFRFAPPSLAELGLSAGEEGSSRVRPVSELVAVEAALAEDKEGEEAMKVD